MLDHLAQKTGEIFHFTEKAKLNHLMVGDFKYILNNFFLLETCFFLIIKENSTDIQIKREHSDDVDLKKIPYFKNTRGAVQREKTFQQTHGL